MEKSLVVPGRNISVDDAILSATDVDLVCRRGFGTEYIVMITRNSNSNDVNQYLFDLINPYVYLNITNIKTMMAKNRLM